MGVFAWGRVPATNSETSERGRYECGVSAGAPAHAESNAAKTAETITARYGVIGFTIGRRSHSTQLILLTKPEPAPILFAEDT
jgi:hypothetical protein